MRALGRIVVPLVLLWSVAGCGEGSSGGTAPEGGDVPVTAGALAYVAAEHAGQPDSATASEDVDELGNRAVGVEMRYASDGEYDGDVLIVGVGETDQMTEEVSADCEAEANASMDGCDQTDEGVLVWQDEEPEEDPGFLYVLVEKDGTTVVVGYGGPTLTQGKDPRDLDLPISVDTLFAIANDPRVDQTTSQAAIDGGQDAGYGD